MHKTIVALRHRTGEAASFDLSTTSIRELSQLVAGDVQRCAIDVPADDDLYDQLGRRPANAPPWDAVAHIWHRNANAPTVLENHFDAVCQWTVDEHTAWDRGADETQLPTSGIKQISFVGARTDLTQQQFAAHYRAHVDIARVHHVGARKYQQNTVVGASDPRSPIGAVSEFWFESVHDLVHEYYAFDDSSAVTRADAANFLEPSSTTWMLVHEYWIARDTTS